MTVEIVALTPELEPRYAEFIRHQPTAVVSHSLGYRDMLRRVLDAGDCHAVAMRGTQMVGAMPAMSAKGPYGLVMNAMPYFGGIGAPLGCSAVRAALVNSFVAQAARLSACAFTVIDNPFDPLDSVPADTVDLRAVHVTPLTALRSGDKDLLSIIDASAARNVRKAERLGVCVAIENNAVEVLEGLHRESMALIGAPAKSPVFFEAFPRVFRAGDEYELYVARIDGRAVAALLVFHTAVTTDYFMPAVSPTHRHAQPMASILRRAIIDSAKRGMDRWNWGGSGEAHTTLHRFKAKWGGVAGRYSYFTCVASPQLWRCSAAELTAAYPGFYVLPFGRLGEPPKR